MNIDIDNDWRWQWHVKMAVLTKIYRSDNKKERTNGSIPLDKSMLFIKNFHAISKN